MISYQGIREKNKIPFLILANEKGNSVEIPIDRESAERIKLYLNTISLAPSVPVERLNGDASD